MCVWKSTVERRHDSPAIQGRELKSIELTLIAVSGCNWQRPWIPGNHAGVRGQVLTTQIASSVM